MTSTTRSRLLAATAVALVVVAVVITLATTGGGSSSHLLYAGFDNAIQMTAGQQVRIAGRPVGQIESTKLDKSTRTSIIALRITDPSVWPLPKGTYAVARWGSTTAYLGRYTELIPGPRSNPPLPDGGILSAQQDDTAFELDQAYNLFRGRTAGDTVGLVNRLGQTLDGQGRALGNGLAAAPYGLNQTADVMAQLSANEYELRTLAQAGDRTVGALAARSGDLSNLVTHAAGTFATFAQHTTSEEQALDRAPRAFAAATSTFGRLDQSLNGLTTLIDDLRPGAPLLARMAVVATSTLSTLNSVAPQATDTLRVGIASAPSLTRFFKAGEAFMPPATTTLKRSTPILSCLRPYTPDIAGFLSGWTGQTSHFDAGGHYARSFEATVIPALYPGTPLNSEQAIAASPNITYAFPRPPGMNEGRPYFLPQCDVTPAALNPADDPEGAGK